MQVKTKKAILCVDDEQDVLDALYDTFFHTYKVHLAGSGLDALTALKTDKDIAVVITDNRMPGMTGVELLEEIHKIKHRCKKILLTGYTDLKAAVDALSIGGANLYATKPWDEEELRQSVEHLVNINSAEQIIKRAFEDCKHLDTRVAQAHKYIESLDRFNILIIDPSAEERASFIKILNRLFKEASFLEAGNATEAQKKLLLVPIDLVVCEMKLPGMDGIALLQWAKNNPKTKMLPFIISSSYAEIEAVRAIINSGATDFFVKPVSPEVLGRKIKKQIENYRLRVQQKKEIVNNISVLINHQVLSGITGELNKEEPDVKKLADMIARDKKLASLVVNIANSQLISVTPIATVDEALATLNIKALRNVVLPVLQAKAQEYK